MRKKFYFTVQKRNIFFVFKSSNETSEMSDIDFIEKFNRRTKNTGLVFKKTISKYLVMINSKIKKTSRNTDSIFLSFVLNIFPPVHTFFLFKVTNNISGVEKHFEKFNSTRETQWKLFLKKTTFLQKTMLKKDLKKKEHDIILLKCSSKKIAKQLYENYNELEFSYNKTVFDFRCVPYYPVQNLKLVNWFDQEKERFYSRDKSRHLEKQSVKSYKLTKDSSLFQFQRVFDFLHKSKKSLTKYEFHDDDSICPRIDKKKYCVSQLQNRVFFKLKKNYKSSRNSIKNLFYIHYASNQISIVPRIKPEKILSEL